MIESRKSRFYSLFLWTVLVVFSVPVFAFNSKCSEGEICYPVAFPIKGGVAVLRDDTYVIVRGEKNGVIVHGEKWYGESFGVDEVVVTDTEKVSKDISVLNADNLIVVIFSKADVKVLDLKNSKSYKYPRVKEN